MRYLILVLLMLLVVPGRALCEEFSWTWEDETPGKTAKSATGSPAADPTQETNAAVSAETVAPAMDPAAETQPVVENKTAQTGETAKVPEEPKKKEFAWSWEGGSESGEVSASTAPADVKNTIVPETPRVVESPKPGKTAEAQKPEVKAGSGASAVAEVTERSAGTVAVSEYDEIVRENIELRKKMGDAQHDKDAIAKENQTLSRQVEELTAKIDEAVTKIKELRKSGPADGANSSAALEGRIKMVQAEKDTLANELIAAQKKLAAQPAVTNAPVAPASDLVKDMQRENAQLKDELARAQADRQNVETLQRQMEQKVQDARDEVASATARQKELKDRLADEQTSDRDSRTEAGKLQQQVPVLENQLAELKASMAEKERDLDAKSKESEDLKKEAENRDRRVRKLESMTAMLQKADSEVGKAAGKEKRDMYYNMAVVYAKEGRYEDAEREYLHALRMDPSDADVHFNLGILYDQDLKNKAKAALHYRTYLKLNPYGSDSDAVKQWLMAIEIKQK